ncbi:MAG: TraR/DksA family transcriptional regulator [Hyphomicrobiales bacterium]
MSDIDPEIVRERLEALRESLRAESEATADARDPVTLDQQSVGRLSRMDAMAGQHMAAANERARQAQIVKIDAALRRLNDGDYGYCTNCDEPIAPKRLDADPTASLCIACQSAREA